MSKGDWLHVLASIAPIVVAAIPGAAPIAPFIGAAIHEAESIPGGTSDQKKAHAMNLVGAAIASVNTQAGHTVIDPQLAAATADEAIDTTIAAVNLVHARGAAAATDT